jgi:hypothetical protein
MIFSGCRATVMQQASLYCFLTSLNLSLSFLFMAVSFSLCLSAFLSLYFLFIAVSFSLYHSTFLNLSFPFIAVSFSLYLSTFLSLSFLSIAVSLSLYIFQQFPMEAFVPTPSVDIYGGWRINETSQPHFLQPLPTHRGPCFLLSSLYSPLSIYISPYPSPPPVYLYIDKKENKIFIIYKEIQMGLGAKSYLNEEGLPNI